MAESSLKGQKTLWERGKTCSLRTFFPFPTVFSKDLLQTRENQGLFEKEFKYVQIISFSLFLKRQILDSSKLKEFADDNFEFDEKNGKFSKWAENGVGKE